MSYDNWARNNRMNYMGTGSGIVLATGVAVGAESFVRCNPNEIEGVTILIQNSHASNDLYVGPSGSDDNGMVKLAASQMISYNVTPETMDLHLFAAAGAASSGTIQVLR